MVVAASATAAISCQGTIVGGDDDITVAFGGQKSLIQSFVMEVRCGGELVGRFSDASFELDQGAQDCVAMLVEFESSNGKTFVPEQPFQTWMPPETAVYSSGPHRADVAVLQQLPAIIDGPAAVSYSVTQKRREGDISIEISESANVRITSGVSGELAPPFVVRSGRHEDPNLVFFSECDVPMTGSSLADGNCAGVALSELDVVMAEFPATDPDVDSLSALFADAGTPVSAVGSFLAPGDEDLINGGFAAALPVPDPIPAELIYAMRVQGASSFTYVKVLLSVTSDPCGDSVCAADESFETCPEDCPEQPTEMCPNGTCDPSETYDSCPQDCPPPPAGDCGNGTCEPSEHCDTCTADCGACAGPAPSLARSSYLQSGGTDRVVVKWRTDQATDSVVVFGTDPENLTSRVDVTGTRQRHEVAITGLAPDTAYYYAYGDSDHQLHGADQSHYFRTNPAVGTARPTRIWVIGDSGKPGSDQQDVYNQYLAYTGSRATDLWLMLGDNAYSDGKDSEYQAAVFDAYPGLLRNTMLWPTLGNHDDCLNRGISDTGCADLPTSLGPSSADFTGPYYDIFTLPTEGEAGGWRSGTEAYYSFDYGNIHFVSLNSQTHRSSTAMQDWLIDDLSMTNADWVIAFWHHPPYSNGSHNSDRSGSLEDMRANFVTILEDYGVDMVFAGHSHNYERSAFLSGYYGDSSTYDPDQHVVARNGDGSISDGDPSGDGAYQKQGSSGAVYSVVGSSSKISSSDYPTDYWTCKDGHMMSCAGGPILPGMVLYLDHLGSVVIDINEATGVADVVFLDATDGDIGDRYRIVK